MATKKTPVPQPSNAKEYLLESIKLGLHMVQNYSDNSHEFSKITPPFTESVRLLWEIECQEREDARRAPRHFPNPTPKCDSNLRRLGAE